MKRQEFIDAVSRAGWIPRGDAQATQIGTLWKQLFPKDAEIEFLSAEADAAMLLKKQRDNLLLALEPFAIFACDVPPGEVCRCHNCEARKVITRIKEGA
jgi:hypothetical protein